jgi:hypothetical protein
MFGVRYGVVDLGGEPSPVSGLPRRDSGPRWGTGGVASGVRISRRRSRVERCGITIPFDSARWPRFDTSEEVTVTDNPDLVVIEQLLDLAKQRGFVFVPAGDDGSL